MTALRQPGSAVKLWRDVSIVSQAAMGRDTAARRDVPSPRTRQSQTPRPIEGFGSAKFFSWSISLAHSLAEAHSTPHGSLGRRSMQDTVGQFPRIWPFYELRWITLRRDALGLFGWQHDGGQMRDLIPTKGEAEMAE